MMVKSLFIIIIIISLSACRNSDYSAEEYFTYINQAELQITKHDFTGAAEFYAEAFNKIEKPFGKDLYNASIVNSVIGNQTKVTDYIQILINNTEDHSFLESILVNTYISRKEWNRIIGQREIAYDSSLRCEMERIKELDQQFRPLYDTHMDTIEKIRTVNLDRIFQFLPDHELPAHQEIGYSKNLGEQPHHIVFHHTAQRRSQDKTVAQLDNILKDAVYMGKLDPEQAISYLRYQNDMGAGPYEVYTIFQIQHPLLHDSLQNKSWEVSSDEYIRTEADSVRKTWFASSLGEISIKAQYLKSSEHPFIFSGIQKAIYKLPEDFNEDEAMEQYEMQTSRGIEQKELNN